MYNSIVSKLAIPEEDDSRQVYYDYLKDFLDSKNDDKDIDLNSVLQFIPGGVDLSNSEFKKEDDIKISKTKKSTISYKPSKGEKEFENAYIKAVGKKDEYYDLLSKIARYESGYNPLAKNPNAPAYGYFQFMQDGIKYNNISSFAGVDIDTFKNTPEIQILAARKMLDSIFSQIRDKDLVKMREKGITREGFAGLAWLGGVGGARNFLHYNKNISDKHWSPNGSGIDMKSQLVRYNKLGCKFQSGGQLQKDIDKGLNENIDKLQYLTDVFRRYGATDDQIAAISGNIWKESSFDEFNKNANSGAYGLFQMLGERKKAYDHYLIKTGLEDSFKTQVDYMAPIIFGEGNPHGLDVKFKNGDGKYRVYDIGRNEWGKSRRDKFFNSKDLKGYTDSFATEFERPSDSELDLDTRNKASSYVLDLLMNYIK